MHANIYCLQKENKVAHSEQSFFPRRCIRFYELTKCIPIKSHLDSENEPMSFHFIDPYSVYLSGIKMLTDMSSAAGPEYIK